MKAGLSEFCVPGTQYTEQYIPVGSNVSLRIVSFTPVHESGFPAIVFVPGWISLMSAWGEVLRELTRDFRIIYLETREKKTSRTSGNVGYAVEDIAKDIAHVVSELKCSDNGFVLLGSSLGATAVIESCRFLTKEPRCLVLIAPNAEFLIPSLGLFIIKVTTPYLYFIIKPIIKWYLRVFRLDVHTDHAQYTKYCNCLDAADPWKLKKAAIAFSNYTVWSTLGTLSVPVLLFGASKDVLHEPENMAKMVALMKQVTQVDLETNRRTHSTGVVRYLRDYLTTLEKGVSI